MPGDSGAGECVERHPATDAERRLGEINTGILIAPTEKLGRWLAQLGRNNAQGEYYLTDVIAAAVADRCPVHTVQPDFEWEILGVNTKQQLAYLERVYQRGQAARLLEQGVTVQDPERIDIRGELICEQDVVIDVNCVFEGKVTLEQGATVGANCVIRDSHIEAGAQILPFCHVEGSRIGQRARVGPYARLRLGIGRPPPDFRGTGADFVLEAFAPSERADLDDVIGRAADAIALVAERGVSVAMNATNQRKKR